jgi:hypothetical protein
MGTFINNLVCMLVAIVPKATHPASKKQRNYVCRICHLTFTTLNDYVNHLKEVHPESNEALATGVSRVDLLEDGSEP